MMARQIAARGCLCAGAACPVFYSPALAARRRGFYGGRLPVSPVDPRDVVSFPASGGVIA